MKIQKHTHPININRNKQNAQLAVRGMTSDQIAKINNRSIRRMTGQGKAK